MFSKDFLNEEAIYKLNIIVEMENKLDRNDLVYKTGYSKKDKKSGFQKFKTIRSFEREIYGNDLSLDDVLEQKIRLKDGTDIFQKIKKALTLKNGIILQRLPIALAHVKAVNTSETL